MIRGKNEGRLDGAKCPTAGDEPREFTSRGEGGRVPPFIPHSRCTENSMVDLSERPGANPQGMPKFWQQKILYRNQKANLSKPHGSTNLLFSKKSPLSGPMYHQISKRRSVSQEQNTLLKSQNPGNVGYQRSKVSPQCRSQVR